MSGLTKRILESGLVDETTAELMEKWGVLPEGSASIAAGKALELERTTIEKDVREKLMKMAEKIGDEVDAYRKARETMLDLNQLRWPVQVDIRGHPSEDTQLGPNGTKFIAGAVVGVVDRMGRFYFRPQDVNREWFRPGYVLEQRDVTGMDGRVVECRVETILEVDELFIGEELAAIQVSTK